MVKTYRARADIPKYRTIGGKRYTRARFPHFEKADAERYARWLRRGLREDNQSPRPKDSRSARIIRYRLKDPWSPKGGEWVWFVYSRKR